MKGINSYWKQLSPEEISASKHREFVGGLWEELGILQFQFMKAHGLQPAHSLLDVGCGALRGGLFFIDYLETGHYCGLDINASLIQAGEMELAKAGLLEKKPRLIVNDAFDVSLFEKQFDFGIAVSVFTHVFANHIVRCLVQVARVLKPGGKLYASFFEAPSPAHIDTIAHSPGGVITKYDSDPFHYSIDEMQSMAGRAGMQLEYIGDWGHPRDQKMLCFTLVDRTG